LGYIRNVYKVLVKTHAELVTEDIKAVKLR